MNIVFVQFLLFELFAIAWAKVCFQKSHLFLMHWSDWGTSWLWYRWSILLYWLFLIIIWTDIFKLLLSFIVKPRPCAADVMLCLLPTVETPNTDRLFGSIEFFEVKATVTYWVLIGCDVNRHSKSANIDTYAGTIPSYWIISSNFVVTLLLYLLSVISIELLLRSFQMRFALTIAVHC